MKFIKRCLTFLVGASMMIAICGVLLRVKQMPIQVNEVEAAIGVPYVIDHIPVSNKRPGTNRQIKYIVVHNTANEQSSARNERDYLTNPNNQDSTSFHIVVDNQEAIEAIPVTEVAFHAGTWDGNQYGIGIEVCESGNYAKNEAQAAKLVAYLIKKYDLSLKDVKAHHDFSGKDCPRLILDHWDEFLTKVQEAYRQLED